MICDWEWTQAMKKFLLLDYKHIQSKTMNMNHNTSIILQSKIGWLQVTKKNHALKYHERLHVRRKMLSDECREQDYIVATNIAKFI